MGSQQASWLTVVLVALLAVACSKSPATDDLAAGLGDDSTTEEVTAEAPDPAPPAGPSISITCPPSSEEVGPLADVEFEHQMTAGDAPLTQWQIDYGDGRVFTAAEERLVFSHQYKQPGQFLVRITVTDAAGLSDSDDCEFAWESPPVVITLTHPDDLRAALRAAARDLIGKEATGREEQFIAEYHALEREQQTRAQTGRTHYTVEPNSQARAFIERNMAAEILEYRTLILGKAALDIMRGNCHSSYPDFCIPPSPPDLDCADVSGSDFTVRSPDPHRFDADYDGVGCES